MLLVVQNWTSDFQFCSPLWDSNISKVASRNSNRLPVLSTEMSNAISLLSSQEYCHWPLLLRCDHSWTFAIVLRPTSWMRKTSISWNTLTDFHKHKDSILTADARRGKGNWLIDNWYIPKLELMQNIAPSVRHSGVAIQWTVDITEHAHITEIKDPAWQSNNNNYDPQIC